MLSPTDDICRRIAKAILADDSLAFKRLMIKHSININDELFAVKNYF
jgi:hypothetical protein